MYANPFTLTNKKILITGASSGIGRATAIACSGMGATVYITGRNKAELDVTGKLMHNDSYKQIVADLNSIPALENLVNSLPALDGIISNAGINRRMIAQYVKEQNLDLIINTNLKAPILLIKGLLKAKKINVGASVVFISSIAAYHSSIGDGVYSATKGGLCSFSKVLALELASKKIRVNTIQPGMVYTALTDKGPLSEEDYNKDEQKYPLGRYGKPEEIANAAVYLLSDASQWITGTDLVIDGGISLI
jgi:NAD(P)-dependent dehydrogenase (short-subunit alcohol dehydrogenase family)